MLLCQQCICNRPGGFRKPNDIVPSQHDDETLSFSTISGEYLMASIKDRYFCATKLT